MPCPKFVGEIFVGGAGIRVSVHAARGVARVHASVDTTQGRLGAGRARALRLQSEAAVVVVLGGGGARLRCMWSGELQYGRSALPSSSRRRWREVIQLDHGRSTRPPAGPFFVPPRFPPGPLLVCLAPFSNPSATAAPSRPPATVRAGRQRRWLLLTIDKVRDGRATSQPGIVFNVVDHLRTWAAGA